MGSGILLKPREEFDCDGHTLTIRRVTIEYDSVTVEAYEEPKPGPRVYLIRQQAGSGWYGPPRYGGTIEFDLSACCYTERGLEYLGR